MGISASNNLIKKCSHKITHYFVFSCFHVQISHYIETHIFSTFSIFFLEMSPYPPQLTLNAISSNKCLIFPVSQRLDKLHGLSVSVHLDHYTHKEMATAVFSTALHGPSPEVLGTEDQSDGESCP